ncbi:hypothetical protein, partial [Actinomadura rubrisoli]
MTEQEEARHALAEQFPDWLIDAEGHPGGTIWHASRLIPPGRGGSVGVQADEPGLLHELLDEADRTDARLALRDVAAGLRERGVTVHAFATNLIVTERGPDEPERLITCKRGTFHWGMGKEIGPIGDVPGAVGH